MKTLVVTCKEKHALHERIVSIGCLDEVTNERFRYVEDEAIQKIESSQIRFIVRDGRGHEAVIEVEERDGRKYLATKPDHFKTDNLLALPDCAAKSLVPPPYRPVSPARSHCVTSVWKQQG